MSTEFDDISKMLNDLLDGKDIDAEPESEVITELPELQPEPEPEKTETVATVVETDDGAMVVADDELVSEHVFTDPPTDEALPLPTFTSDDIAESIDIRNFATLVTLNTARWQGKVKDRKAAKDAADAAGASANAFEVKKKLLADCDKELKDVYKEIDAARTEHYRLTLPWSTIGVNEIGKRTGGRLMPNTLFLEYTQVMANRLAAMEEKLDIFESKYPSLMAKVKQKLGTAYDPAQYPNPSSIRKHFRLSFDFHPIPVGSDFKGLQDAQIEKLSDSLNRKTMKMLENAMQEAWHNLYESVEHAYTKLSNPDATFHKTLIDRLRDQVKLLQHLNATKDPRMEEIRDAIGTHLTKYEAKAIRDDDVLRRSLGERAKEILDRMKEIANEETDD